VVAGEALVDLISAAGHAASAASATMTAMPGGGPYNAARAVARLGVPTSFLGALSRDRFGRLLHDTLVADGVDLSLAPRVEEPTTLAVAELDADGAATYRFYLDGTSATVLNRADADAVRLDPPSALHVGTLGLVLLPGADVLAELVADLPPQVLVLADPNCRPSAIGTGAGQQAYRSRLDAVLDRADVVKVSTEDLAYLVPGAEPLAAAARIRRSGHQVVLVTDGARAAVAVHPDGALVVPVPPVHVVDTVGAGDTFGGAFLATWVAAGRGPQALADTVLLGTALRRAVRAAALACTRAGAQPPTAAELDRDPAAAW
jgi:fructokinase